MTTHSTSQRLRPWNRPLAVVWTAVLVVVNLGWGSGFTPRAYAADDMSYQALRHWIEQYRPVPPSFTPGQHLQKKTKKRLSRSFRSRYGNTISSMV